MARVSIVTISFNQAEFLERTILSVLTQDHPDIEYIMVDPGSTDGSRDIIERYRSRISQIILQPDKGAADGLNHGFAQATGEILGFLNSDDVLLPGAISSAVTFLERNKEIDIVSGHSNLIAPDDRILRRLFSDRMSISRSIYGGVILMQPSTFFRKSIFDRTNGFNVENRMSWDSELFLDMALAGAKFALVEEFWSGFRVHGHSITNSRTIGKMHKAQAAVFSRITGRERRKTDEFVTFVYRMLRHILNPRDTWERICRGPVGGRVFTS